MFQKLCHITCITPLLHHPTQSGTNNPINHFFRIIKKALKPAVECSMNIVHVHFAVCRDIGYG